MAITLDRDDLEKLLEEAADRAVTKYTHRCRIPISDDDAAQLGELISDIKEVSPDGSIITAGHLIRDNHRTIARWNRFWEAVGRKIGLLILTAIMGGLIYWLQAGAQAILGHKTP